MDVIVAVGVMLGVGVFVVVGDTGAVGVYVFTISVVLVQLTRSSVVMLRKRNFFRFIFFVYCHRLHGFHRKSSKNQCNLWLFLHYLF